MQAATVVAAGVDAVLAGTGSREDVGDKGGPRTVAWSPCPTAPWDAQGMSGDYPACGARDHRGAALAAHEGDSVGEGAASGHGEGGERASVLHRAQGRSQRRRRWPGGAVPRLTVRPW